MVGVIIEVIKGFWYISLLLVVFCYDGVEVEFIKFLVEYGVNVNERVGGWGYLFFCVVGF